MPRVFPWLKKKKKEDNTVQPNQHRPPNTSEGEAASPKKPTRSWFRRLSGESLCTRFLKGRFSKVKVPESQPTTSIPERVIGTPIGGQRSIGSDATDDTGRAGLNRSRVGMTLNSAVMTT